MSLGCGLVNRTRRIPGTAPTAMFDPDTARATGPGPLRAGRRAVLAGVGLVERERLGADFVAGVRVDVARVDRDGLLPEADFLVEEVPEVRLRGGALDRLAMSREYPWVAGIPGVTGVTRVAGPGHAVSPAFTLDMAALHTGFASKWLPCQG